MKPQKHTHNWIHAAAGVLVLMLAGMVYAWSVLSAPIASDYPQWTQTQLSFTFTLVMLMFCAGCTVGGLASGRLKPPRCVQISAVLFLVGFLLAAQAHSLLLLYIGFGGLCGFASGFAYNAVLSSIRLWYPDHQGLISGILLMGFGIGAFLIGKGYQAYTPQELGGWRRAFSVLGVMIFLALAACSRWIVCPARAQKDVRCGRDDAQEYPPRRMLRTAHFWLYYLWVVALSTAGLALVSQAGGIAREVGVTQSAARITTAVGLISVANGVGRVILGFLYDRIGRRLTMLAICALYFAAGGVLLLALARHSFALVLLGFVLGGLGYGGVNPTNSAFILSYFGSRNYPVNFSLINTNLLLSSFGGTIAGALYDHSCSYQSCYVMFLALTAAAVLLSMLITRMDKRAYGNKNTERM